MLESVTFFLAVAGYAGLSAASVLAGLGPGRLRPWFVRVSAFVVVAHVAMVWAVRYRWSVELATRNGWAPFFIFHTALALIVAAAFAPARVVQRFLWPAFAAVSLGALGAVFTYDVVAHYRFPVIVLAIAGTGGIARALWPARDTTRKARIA